MTRTTSAAGSVINDAHVADSKLLIPPDAMTTNSDNSLNATSHRNHFHGQVNPNETAPAYNPSYVPIESESAELNNQRIKNPGNDGCKGRVKRRVIYTTIFFAVSIIGGILKYNLAPSPVDPAVYLPENFNPGTEIQDALKFYADEQRERNRILTDPAYSEKILEMIRKEKQIENAKKSQHDDYYGQNGNIPIQNDD